MLLGQIEDLIGGGSAWPEACLAFIEQADFLEHM